MNNRRRRRSGYAMVLVLLFIVLFLSFWSLAYRSLGSAVRVEATRALRQQRDEGAIHAVAQGIALLETGLPPNDPYTCGVSITTGTGLVSYTVTFSSDGAGNWTVRALPSTEDEVLSPMPTVFEPLTAMVVEVVP